MTGLTRTVLALAGALLVGGALAGCTGEPDPQPPPSGSASAVPTGSATASQQQVLDAMLENGIRQAGEGRYDDATSTFQAILAIDPASKYALYNLGLVAQIHDRADEAVDYYQQALAVDPEFTSAMYNQAIALEPTDPARAEDLYRQIVDLDPEASTAFLRLSFLYAAGGRQDEADAARASALALDPTLATVSPSPPPTPAP